MLADLLQLLLSQVLLFLPIETVRSKAQERIGDFMVEISGNFFPDVWGNGAEE